MAAAIGLWCVATAFAIAVAGVALARRPAGTPIVYGGCLVVSIVALASAVVHLGAALPASSLALPIGLPWIGAHFRVDALAAFFLIVVNLGAAAASLYALGYGRHEPAPLRVLPFYPAFLGAMNLVVMADDAFSFLLAWEFMSLASWTLVVSHHRDDANRRAGYVYLLMASAGTMCLLLAFGLLAGSQAGYAFAAMRASPPAAMTATAVVVLALIGAGSKAGLVPLH
ncbi:MAG: hydrogenase 4 subunit B, partial [Proteobacteria bacterium]|nr:hydrogenase 4 subunit B [Pseudomonadota bacterium]